MCARRTSTPSLRSRMALAGVLLLSSCVSVASLSPYTCQTAQCYLLDPVPADGRRFRLLDDDVVGSSFQSSVYVKRSDGSHWETTLLQTSEMEAFLNVSVALRPEDVSSGAICHAGDESGSDVLAGVDTDMVSGVDFLMSRRTRLKDGEYWSTMLPIPVPDFTSIYKAFSLGGFTLIVNRAHRRWRPIASICELVGRTIALFPINANLYLTPKLAQGFEAHQDWMEVIVIQLEGMKHWRLYPDFPSVRLPFPEMIVKPSSSSLTKERALDLTLSPGDVLYIPAGVVHEASTGTTDTISLHVTIGIEIHPVDTWLGLMLSAMRFMSNAMSRPTLLCLALYEVAVRPESAPLRRAIPHGDWIAGQHSMVFSYFKDLLTDTLADVAIERALLIRRDTVNAQVVTCLEPWPTCDDSVSCNDDFESDKQTLRSITAISFSDVTSSYVESARHRQRSKSAQTNRELERVAERLRLYVESKVQPKAELYTSSGPSVDSTLRGAWRLMASGIRRVGAEGHASDDDVDVVVADEQVRDGFCVVGRPVRLVPPTDDADSFKLVMSERYLLPVSGNDEELADRYDARHLLDTSVLVATDRFKADRPRVPADSEEESIYVQDGPGDIVMTEADIDQLQTERYIDLLIHKRARQEVNQGFDDAMRAFKRRQTVSERTLAQCRPPVQHVCIREEHPATNSERFRPSFIVPSHITTLPESLEVHSLIEKTAKFARTNVPQAEVLLKIRQDHNPKFRFLLADDNLNPYYEYLKKTGVVHDPSSCRRLVSNYDSDDEQDPPAPAALPPTDAGSSASLPQSEIRRLRDLVDARRRTSRK